VFVLTSYDDIKTQKEFPIESVGADTKAGMANCFKETRKYAREKDTNPQPQNTRSDPADRIRRFREGIGTTQLPIEDRDKVRDSEYYRKSLKFLLQCVLAPLYGEKINVIPLKSDELSKEARFPGRGHFIKAILDALKMDEKNIYTLRNRMGRIVGLLSNAGPIPVVEDAFSLPELKIDETKDLSFILDKILSKQDKEVLAFWLSKTAKTNSLLYEDLRTILEKDEKIAESLEISEVMEIDITNGVAGFPYLKRYGEAVLSDKITVVPIREDDTPFGYNMKPLYFKAVGLNYVFLPPLTLDTIAATTIDDFSIEKIEIPEGISDPTAPKELRLPLYMEDDKLVSVTIRCVLKNKSLRQIVRRTYSGGEIRYIKSFPSLTVYGPVPKHGWIARRDRDINITADYPSPLKSESTERTTFKDIVFANTEIKKTEIKKKEGKDEKSEAVSTVLNFSQTTDKYDLYQGPIPLWLEVRTPIGDTLGGLPLRVVSQLAQEDWETTPNYIHTKNPTGRLIVAADIGSSRSIILFYKEGDPEKVFNEIFIEDKQPLGIPITTYFPADEDVKFGMMNFQPEDQKGSVKGKTPIGLLTTDAFLNEEKEQMELFSSGKLILLDPKSISDASTRRILSDIKVGNDPKSMYLLAQSLLTLIIDRAMHLQCKEIELRLSYLVERYSNFQKAWENAIKKCKERWPEIKVKLDMYLPESLAIANDLKHEEGRLSPSNGAAIVDIGDFTTDIALFTSKPGGKDIELKDNLSFQFAGRQIILQPIWDYLLFTGAKIESLYKPDMMKLPECINAVARLEAAREKQKQERNQKLSDDVRRDLLCLMGNFNNDEIPVALQNLIDICYLTEIVILKRIVRNEPIKKMVSFDIHLFGGGRSLIKEKPNEKKDGYDWDTTFGRLCTINLPENDGKTLARGLLQKNIHDELKGEAKKMKEKAELWNDDNGKRKFAIEAPSNEELVEAYIRFLQNAQKLKKWDVFDANDNRVSPGRLFNVKKVSKDSDGVIEDESLFGENFNASLEFAMAGTVTDLEIVKTLFAYKMAYNSAVAFYRKPRK